MGWVRKGSGKCHLQAGTSKPPRGRGGQAPSERYCFADLLPFAGLEVGCAPSLLRAPLGLVVAGRYCEPARQERFRSLPFIGGKRGKAKARHSRPTQFSLEKSPCQRTFISLADARAVRTERAPYRPGPGSAHPALGLWAVSKKGNPWFRSGDWLFVALEPRWKSASWRLWVKGDDQAGQTLPADYASFGALQRGVVAFLAEMSMPARALGDAEG